MKKLLIIASVALFASGLNAANFSWGFFSGDVLDPSGNYIDGGTASLYINNVLIATGGQNADYNFGVFDNSAVDTTGKVQT